MSRAILIGLLVIAFVVIGCEKAKAPAEVVTTAAPEGEIIIDYSIVDSALIIRNISGRDLNDVMVSIDIYKDHNSDSTLLYRQDRLVADESVTITQWTKILGGRSTLSESLPDAEYSIKSLEVSCEEGDFWADL